VGDQEVKDNISSVHGHSRRGRTLKKGGKTATHSSISFEWESERGGKKKGKRKVFINPDKVRNEKIVYKRKGKKR